MDLPRVRVLPANGMEDCRSLASKIARMAEVDTMPVKVPAVRDDVAEVDAHSEGKARIIRPSRHRALDSDFVFAGQTRKKLLSNMADGNSVARTKIAAASVCAAAAQASGMGGERQGLSARSDRNCTISRRRSETRQSRLIVGATH